MRKALFILLAIPLLGGLVLWALSAYERSRALRVQAEATLAAARATHTAVLANSALVYGLLCMVLLWTLTVLALVFWFGRRGTPALPAAPKRKWLPGPNARWGRVGDGRATLPDTNIDRTLDTLLRLKTLEALAALTTGSAAGSAGQSLGPAPASPTPALPPGGGASHDEGSWDDLFDGGLGDDYDDLWW